jgi:hypothetical protein
MTETLPGLHYDESNPPFSFNSKYPNEYNDADVQELFRAYNESGDDFNRNFISLMVGDADGPFDCQTITVKRGDAEALKEEWESLREFYSGKHWDEEDFENGNELVKGGARDIGPVENAFFIVADDNNQLSEPFEQPGFEGWPITDVWNFFWNCWDDAKRKQVWDQFKKDYQTVYQQVAAATIEPPPEGQRYFYYDRTD